MWCVLLPPNRAASELRARGWASISTTAATADIRSSSSKSCLSMTQVRLRFWLCSRNSIAAQRIRRCRSRLIKWIKIGSPTSGRNHSSDGKTKDVIRLGLEARARDNGVGIHVNGLAAWSVGTSVWQGFALRAS